MKKKASLKSEILEMKTLLNRSKLTKWTRVYDPFMYVYPGCKPWSNAMEILDEKDGMDTELLVYAMTLINKVPAQYLFQRFQTLFAHSQLHVFVINILTYLWCSSRH